MMDIDDDDEFGDLYTDVLRPLSAAAPSIPNPPPLDIPAKNPSSGQPLDVLAPLADEEAKDDWLPDNWNDDGDEVVAVAKFGEKAGAGDAARAGEVRASGSVEDGDEGGKGGGFRVSEEEKVEIGDLDQEPVIPGLSVAPLPSNGGRRVSNSDDWDSDSEDDLQIVLNENTHLPIGGERHEDDDDEDGEDLVIVTDEDQQHHHHHQAVMEEHEWAEGEQQPVADGERKEGSDAAKVNGAVGSIGPGQRIGYSNHGFHQQHHSMFKYVRPGAAPGAPTVGPPGQIRPPTVVAGRGRGDWRSGAGRGIPGASRGFHSGYGPGWANNSSRAFGGGLDFTLPSHKSIFDVDIENFEEKPWRYPGVDISDYFNFGLDEEKWKEYCKLLDQLRLESTMQSKIRVYESGRSEQEYDPDLPPELAAAAGHHNIPSDNMTRGRSDNTQSDLSGHGRGLPCMRAPFPPGRAIQVETGFGERLPSIDTRPPRTRDADAIIEIVLQDSGEDSTIHNGAQELREKDIQGEELKRVNDAEGDCQGESEYYDRIPETSNSHQREMGSRRVAHASEGDGVMPFPPESPYQYDANSRRRSPTGPAGSSGGGEKSKGGALHGRNPSTSGTQSNDSLRAHSALEKKHDDEQEEMPGNSTETDQSPEQSPAFAAETTGELSLEPKDEDILVLAESVEAEGEETSDFKMEGDESTIHSSMKQKLSSLVEQTANQDSGEDDDLKTHSENSRAKSGSSTQKQRESADEEVQGGRSRRTSDLRKVHDEDEHSLRRKDDHGRESRHDIDRKRMGSKGQEPGHQSNSHRDWDLHPLHPVRGRNEGFERLREPDSSFWHRRGDETHVRRIKDEEIRRERNEEAGSRNRSKVRASERNDKDDDPQLKKRSDDGDWRGHNREGGPRLRERDDVLSRRDHIDDHHAKRRKDEEHSRRERSDKEDSLHGYRSKEDSIRRKRERDETPDHRRNIDSGRLREKADDHHSSKNKDEIWRQRERDERQRLKHSHEDPLPHREREEGRGAARSIRGVEDKLLGVKNKNDPRSVVPDKDHQHRDRRRHGEDYRRGDRAGEENEPQHKGRENILAREKRHKNEERSSRHERPSGLNGRHGSSDNPQISRERHREVTRKSKDNGSSTQNPSGPGKRKHEDAHRNEKVNSKGLSEKESNDRSLSNQLPHSSEKQGEEELASGDENQHESKRGRSKLERWTSHKERDFGASNNLQPSFSIVKETVDGPMLTDELPRTEGNDSDPKGADGGQAADKSADERDRHLDTVEKLKRRSERFKLPMPGEKDVGSSKRSENDPPVTQNEAPTDAEVKPERPARKRRWTGS